MAVLALEQPFLEEHPDHLLDEERVAARTLDEARPGRLVELSLAEDPLDEQAAGLAGQRLQVHGRRIGPSVAPARPDVVQLRPRQADEQDARVAGVFDDVLEQVEERLLAPLDVVEDDDDRLLARERLEESPERPERLLLRHLAVAETDGGGDLRCHQLGVRLPAQAAGEARAELGDRVVVRHLRQLTDDLRDGPVGDALAVREAAPLGDERVARHGRDELADEPRLPDSGGPDDRDDVAGAIARHPLVSLLQQPELVRAADQRAVEARARGGARSHGA